jgi:G:T-mismatch repair DNA endonuclease (very short patch repair protein)
MAAPEIGWSREEIRLIKANGFDVAYWTGERWAHHTPKQFTTPEQAFEEWSEKVKKRYD